MALASVDYGRFRLAQRSAAEQLSAFVRKERAWVLRRWRRELRSAALSPPDFEATLAPLVDELVRLSARGGSDEDLALIFGERLAGHGTTRYHQRARLRDAEREVALLEPAVVRVWAERSRALPAELALLLGAIVGEAVVRVARDYARAAEAAEAQLRLATLVPALAQLSELVLVLDRRGAVAMAAGPTQALLGVAADELVGKPGRTAGLEALRSGHAVAPAHARLRNCQSGEEHVCEVRAFPLRDGDAVVGAVELARDVSLELHHDEELRRADRELTALHARLLRRGHAQAVSELAAATASALNNELNAITMSLQLATAELREPPPESAARHLYAMERAVQRGGQLLQRMQQLAARQPNTPPRAVPLNDVLLEALDLVRPELTATGQRRAMRIDARLGDVKPVVAQPTELRELLATLLLDARDAMPRGGVLHVSTRGERNGACLTLAHALADEAQLAGQAPDATSERATTLAAARDRARSWGGDLVVESPGARVLVRLILPAAAPPPARATPSGGRTLRPARRVLVVDDDAGNRETLTELLALSGHEVRAADSGQAALAEFERDPTIDAALLDLAMPDMDGLELARRLRALAPSTRLALVTGWEPTALSNGREAAGLVDAVFRKPIDFPAILRFLDEDSAGATA
jgi:CheY-like chemotaxis protein